MRAYNKALTNLLMLGVAAGIAISLSACGPKGNSPNIEIIQDMMESPAIRAQEYEDYNGMQSGSMVPPENTAPVGFKRYRYGTDAEAAERELKNPLAGDMSPETLLTGRKYFETHCMVCHGPKGMGDGPVAAKMALKPPSLHSAKVTGWKDGRIYHVITMGQGLMGPYASHVPQAYRWQLVNYIRHLQTTEQKTEKK